MLFLAVVLLLGIKKEDTVSHFFDINNSKAMRGFWCLVVILVHVPTAYQNKIQDMIGSFAYIGVTFFFMTSGYGLTLSSEKNAYSLRYFWRNRLPKLLIPGWLVHFCFAIIGALLFSSEITVGKVFNINGWVRWLLGCYFIFWISHLLTKGRMWKIVASVSIVVTSVVFYYLKSIDIVTSTTWTTECFGFIWGIILASFLPEYVNFFKKSWSVKWVTTLVISLVLGVAYLKFKPIPFFGDYLLKILLGIAITMFVLVANIRFRIGNKISLFLGEISFEIYLSHGKVFSLVSKLIPKLSSGVFILLSIILTVIFAYLIHILAMLITKQLYKISFFKKK